MKKKSKEFKTHQMIKLLLWKSQSFANNAVLLFLIWEFTPEMLYRFADVKCKNIVTRAQFRATLMAIGLSKYFMKFKN